MNIFGVLKHKKQAVKDIVKRMMSISFYMGPLLFNPRNKNHRKKTKGQSIWPDSKLKITHMVSASSNQSACFTGLFALELLTILKKARLEARLQYI